MALMCPLQMQQTSEKNSQWVAHICGAKDVIEAIQSKRYIPGSDSSVILGWVYYYDVLARFSLRHWRTHMVKQTAANLGFDPNGSSPACAIEHIIVRASFARQIPDISIYSHQVLRLLSEVCDTILYPWGPQYYADEYREYLDGLESRLRKSILLTGPDIGTSPQVVIQDVAQVLELFRLAGLVYLERASRNFSGQSTKLEQWTDEAFSIFTKLDACQYPFPLFIFGCEARTDDRRMAILDLIAKTEQDPHVRNVQEVRSLIQSVWIQGDLEVDGEVEYIRKLNLVLSSRDVVPSFV